MCDSTQVHFETTRSLWSVIAPGILFHVPVDESSFEMSQKAIPNHFSQTHCLYVVTRPISWLIFTLAEPPTLSQRTFATSLTCSPMLLSLTRSSVLSSMREKPSQSSSTSTLTWWGFCHQTTTFLLFLFRVNMGWTQMLDCPSLVWTTEMSSTSCESFVTILKNLFDSILHQVGSNIRFQ